MSMTPAEVLKYAEENGAQVVDIKFIDLPGVWHHFSMPLSEFTVDLFEEGASPEEIVAEFESLKLDDVYAVLTYYLRHKEEVQRCLAEQESKAEIAQREIRVGFGHQALRERISKLRRERHGDGR